MGLFPNRYVGCQLYGSSAPTWSAAPNPIEFEVLRNVKVGNHWVAKIHYPNCTNYEGKKVVILRQDPSTMTELDPHFREGGPVVARFEPTTRGFEQAIVFARNLLV